MIGKIIHATEILSHTTVGVVSGNYPLRSGNCFTVVADDGTAYKVVNFVLENLEEAVRRGVAWPIKIATLSERHAVIHDERIPDSWYCEGFCELCCPKSLLPLPQLLTHERQKARGQRVENGADVAFYSMRAPTLPPGG